MSYQIVITNQRGATMRTGPNTSGAEIRPVANGEVLDIERILFSKPQTFDTNSIPDFLQALKKQTVMGDVWCQVSGLWEYKNTQVTGYVALRVFTTNYGVLAGAVAPVLPPLGDRDSRMAEIDEMIRYLSVRRAELSK